MSSKNIIVGNEYFGIKILEYLGKDNNNKKWWKCKCHCGNITNIARYTFNLGFRGQNIGCGCLIGKREIPRSKYFPESFLSAYRHKAKNKNRHFNITAYDLDEQYEKQSGLCYYTGTKLTLPTQNNWIRNRDSYNVSIDRVDSNIGYIPNNIVLCTKQINNCKMNISYNRFIEICRHVTNHYK